MVNSCKIVTYHYVRPIKNSQFPEIKGLELDSFVRQIEHFKKKFNFITVEQLIDGIYNQKRIPEKSILLTFDDGLKEHYTHVFPVLRDNCIQGLFFPTSKPIDEKIVLDVHKIHFILACCNDKLDLVSDIYSLINQYKKEHNLKSPEEYFAELAIANRFDPKEIIFIKRILQRGLPSKIRSDIIDQLFSKYVRIDEKSFAEQFYLEYSDISEMRSDGMYFGSHGHTHQWFSHMNNEERAQEIRNSKKFLLKINDASDHMIMCYPHGDYNQDTIIDLRKEGFIAGLTIDVGDAILDKSEAFTIKRYDTNDFSR